MHLVRRVAVIGDLHTEDVRLERVLAHARERSVEQVWCVGDILDGLGDADRTCDLLAEHGVVCVAGNHERWFLRGDMTGVRQATEEVTDRTRAFLEGLPATRRFDSPAGGVLLCHGVGEDDMAFLRPETKGFALQGMPTLRDLMLDEGVAYMVGGHTHDRMVRPFPGLVVVNAGTVHREWEDAGYLVVDFERREVEMFDVGDRTVAHHETVPLPEPLPLQ